MSDTNNPQISPKQLADRIDNWEEKNRAQVETAFSALLERTVHLAIEPPEQFRTEDIEQLFPGGSVKLTVSFGPSGSWHFIFPLSLAGICGGLAKEGKPGAEYKPEEYETALSGLLLQTLVSLELELGDLLGPDISIGKPEFSLDFAAEASGWEDMMSVVWRIQIEDEGEGVILKILEMDPAAAPVYLIEEEPEEIGSREDEAESTIPASIQSGEDQSSDDHIGDDRSPFVKKAVFGDFEDEQETGKAKEMRNFDLLLDISLPITIELGRTKMLVKDVLELGPGSVIELDKLSGEPVDLYVNEKMFARGEVVVIEENFGVRINELLQVDERLSVLK